MRALLIIGTRPEAIKMAPIYNAIRETEGIEARCCITSQHSDLLTPMLEFFKVPTDYDLQVMTPGQTLAEVTNKILSGVTDILREMTFDVILVQGDTTSAFAGALAGFYERVPIAHIEAGLRSFDLAHPFPEEANRRFIDVIADFYFTPTQVTTENLLREGVKPEMIHQVGNTGIDSLLLAKEIVEREQRELPIRLDPERPMVLVTAHRRESFGEPLRRILTALLELQKRFLKIQVVFPMHPNPQVREAIREVLGAQPDMHLIEPLSYPDFVTAMLRADLILTDSGGAEEEAPTLGKPLLVLRETTERPEGIEAGVAELVGTDPQKILDQATSILNRLPIQAHPTNLYGDGQAAQRIVRELCRSSEGSSEG